MSLPGFLRRPAPLQGYVYAGQAEDGPLRGAVPGAVVRTARPGPPWIVVDHALETVVPVPWPGRLWQVQATRPAAAADQPFETAGYTRASEVRVLGEVPLARLFGPQGEHVLPVIDAAGGIGLAEAVRLADARHEGAAAARQRLWRAWGAGAAAGTAMLLAVPGRRGGSPINVGLRVVHGAVLRRAEALAGDAAFEIAGEDRFLREPWQGAGIALCDAALALGDAGSLPADDRAMLLAAWHAVFPA